MWTKRITNPVYNGVLVSITLMYTLILFLVDIDRHIITLGVKLATEMPAFILSALFLLDLLANLIIVGPMNTYSKRKVLILETFLSLSYWTLFIIDIIDVTPDTNLSRFTRINAIFQLRNLRVFELLWELKEFQIISATMQNLTAPITSKLLFLYIVYYLYAILGSWLYGGEINVMSVSAKSPTTPAFYYLLNFNSFASSLVTLFHFMVVNNWIVTIGMYQSIAGPYTFPEVFFASFWCFVTVILLNVIVALIIEIYSSVEPEVARKTKQIKLVLQLMKIVQGADKETVQERFSQVRR